MTLAKCVCGYQPQWGEANGKNWVKCSNYYCEALTPRFSSQILAITAWNRMMDSAIPAEWQSEPLDCFKANQCGPARALLSALADELLVEAAIEPSRDRDRLLRNVSESIRKVLGTKP